MTVDEQFRKVALSQLAARLDAQAAQIAALAARIHALEVKAGLVLPDYTEEETENE